MKASEILRSLADLIDSADQPQDSAQQAIQAVAPQEEPNKNDSDSKVFVPPLQAKLELLKKSEGVPNVYDDGQDDELLAIKKHAGITTAQKEASEDNDITG